MAFHIPSELDLVHEAYSEGLFHPVYAGEIYDHRYRVLRKLGYGMSATVWLVKDIATNHYRAMKVLSADCSFGIDGGEPQEIEILMHIRSSDLNHPGYDRIAHLTDHFKHVGPNGVHKCLIMPVMAENLQSFFDKFATGRINKLVVKRITEQLLQALDYAHSSGVIHTDIKADNVMVILEDESIISQSYLPQTEGCIEPASSASRNGNELAFLTWPNSSRVEPWQVSTVPMSDFYLHADAGFEDLLQVEIVLGDWGLANWADPALRHTNEVGPFELQSPEILLRAPWDETLDIWQLGCLVADMLEGKPLFDGRHAIDSEDTQDFEQREVQYDLETHLIQICESLGPFPQELLNESDPTLVNHFLMSDGYTKNAPSTPYPDLRGSIAHLHGDEKEDFLAMLSGMLKIDPEARLLAKDLLESSWLRADRSGDMLKLPIRHKPSLHAGTSESPSVSSLSDFTAEHQVLTKDSGIESRFTAHHDHVIRDDDPDEAVCLPPEPLNDRFATAGVRLIPSALLSIVGPVVEEKSLQTKRRRYSCPGI